MPVIAAEEAEQPEAAEEKDSDDSDTEINVKSKRNKRKKKAVDGKEKETKIQVTNGIAKKGHIQKKKIGAQKKKSFNKKVKTTVMRPKK